MIYDTAKRIQYRLSRVNIVIVSIVHWPPKPNKDNATWNGKVTQVWSILSHKVTHTV